MHVYTRTQHGHHVRARVHTHNPLTANPPALVEQRFVVKG